MSASSKRMGDPLPPEVVIARAAEALAELCHAAERAIGEEFGNHSQKPWAELDQSQRDSAIKDAITLMRNPDASPSPELSLEERVRFGVRRALVNALTA